MKSSRSNRSRQGTQPIYRLPELPAAGPIYVTETNDEAAAVKAAGLFAVSTENGLPGAASKFDWTPAAGRELVIVAGDPQGQYSRTVLRSVARLRPAPAVKVVTLAIDAIPHDLEAAAEAAEAIDPKDIIGGPLLVCMADVQARPVDWLWPGRIPMGRVTLLVGMPGAGKSFLMAYVAARVTTGSPWPDGAACPKGTVIFISAEDDPADTLRPRLDAHHADCRKIHVFLTVLRPDGNGGLKEVMFTLADADNLRAALEAYPDCKLVVIDPVGSFLGGDTDAHRDNEVRAVLAPVAKLAQEHGAAVVIVAHRRKASSNVADDLALGSRAFTGLARAVLHLSKDREVKGRRLLLSGKFNLGPEPDGLAFSIVGDPPAISWELIPVRMSADEALAEENKGDKPGPEPEARNEAAAWLGKLLASGTVEPSKVKAEAQAAGMAWRTVQRAADALKVIREKSDFTGGWTWRLPEDANEDASPSKGEKRGILASSGNQAENEGQECYGHEDAKSSSLGTFDEEIPF